MPTPTDFYRWFIVDERTGKRRLTRYAMTREQAAERYPPAEPDLRTREIRNLPKPGEIRGNAPPAENHAGALAEFMLRGDRLDLCRSPRRPLAARRLRL